MALTKVSTDGVKDDAINASKLPANSVGASELANNAVDTNAIANQAVTAGKLASGVQTIINNNADNRLITGSGTSNTLNAESSVIIDSSENVGIGTISPVNNSGYGGITLNGDSGAIFSFKDSDVEKTRLALVVNDAFSVQYPPGNNGHFRIDQLTADGSGNITGASERLRIDNFGRVMMNTSTLSLSKSPMLEVRSDSNTSNDFAAVFSANNQTAAIGISYNFIDSFNNNNDAILRIRTNGGDAVHISSNQNVGIGTVNPGQKLEVRQAVASHAVIACNRPNSDTFAVALGNNSSNNGVISVNNTDLLFGRDNSGTFTERMRMLNGGGLTFNGDTAGANALDFYEEGSWTPTALLGVSQINYITCRYTRIGRMVQITARFTAGGSGNSDILRVGGLPFTSGSHSQTSFSIMHNGFDEGGSQEPELHGHISSNTTRIHFYYTRTNGQNWNGVIGTEAVNHELIFSTTYYTDA